jgi:hypothetical protein
MVETAAFETANKMRMQQALESEIDLFHLFVSGEAKTSAKILSVIDKKTGEEHFVEFPTRYPEINIRDLRTGNLESELDMSCAEAQFNALSFIKVLPEKYYLPKTYYLLLESGIIMLGLGQSRKNALLKELRGHRLIEESTKEETQKAIAQEEKKRFKLF